MKKNIIILLVAIISLPVFGQQLPQYTQYFLNDFVINPAVTGTKKAWIGQSNNRFQWVGITDAPRTYIMSVNGPVRNLNMGLGGYIFADVVGPTRRTGAMASYAYHIKINDDIKLSLGANFGVLQFMVDGSKISTKETGDLALSAGSQQVIAPDAGAGFHLYSDRFFVGFSAPQLINNQLQFFDDYDSPTARLSRHFFFTAGYNFDVIDGLVIQPSLFVKYVDPLPVQFDATVRAIIKDKVWFGASYRMDDAVGFMLGYNLLDNLMFGYSYDYATSRIQNYTSGSHEVMLGIRFKDKKQRSIPAEGE